MNKSKLYIISSIFLAIILIVLLLMKQVTFSFIIIILLIISLVLLITNKNDNYLNNFKNIFKLYDYTLVELKEKFNFDDKKVIKTKNFEDLVNAKYGEKKPIFYIINKKNIEFYLKNEEEVYSYILKRE